MTNEGRYHVRVFRPKDAKPVMLLGNRGDSRSTSITNSVEEIAATVAGVLPTARHGTRLLHTCSSLCPRSSV
jgi:hypothetical protein